MLKFFLLILISSCTFLVNQIETPLIRDRAALEKAIEVPTYCPIDKEVSFQLVGNNENAQSVYLDQIKRKYPSLDFLDHFALWSLLQLSIRPDQSSATSRFQILIHLDKKTHYFDFFSEQAENQYPFLYGIEWILKKFGKKKSLEDYLALLSVPVRRNLKVDKEFEDFLVENINEIKNDPELAPFYFRGTDILKESETFPLLDYQKVLKAYRTSQNSQRIIVNTTLTPFSTSQGGTGSCNYDFNLYDNSIFLIDKVIPVANLYGLATKKSAFLASSSQKLDKISSLQGLPLFKGESKVRSSAVCKIESDEGKIWAFSNLSRDPGQHLFHLVRYGLPRSKTTAEVDKLIRHSRHLFLSEPVRLIIESDRSSNEQIENLLKLNIPIYNSAKLGNIWSYTLLKDGSRFIIDDRNTGAYSCH